jgi:hypothetical protein
MVDILQLGRSEQPVRGVSTRQFGSRSVTRHGRRALARRRRVIAGALLVIFSVLLGWHLQGGTWCIVETPSMATAAPVGTLLWVRATPFSSLRVGDIITFHPSTAPGLTYSHRVVALNADGSVSTKGDLNGTVDPWRVHAQDMIGRVDARWWDLGWLVKAVPVLLVGTLLVWLLTRFFGPPKWRLPLRTMGFAIVVAVAIYVVKPLVRAVLVTFTPTPNGASAEIVGTGILPINVSVGGGSANHAEGRAGQLLRVLATSPDDDGKLSVHLKAHLPWWLIVLAAVAMFAPVIYGALVGFAPIAAASVGIASTVAAAIYAGRHFLGGSETVQWGPTSVHFGVRSRLSWSRRRYRRHQGHQV